MVPTRRYFTWLGAIVVPDDRNSTSASNYRWYHSNETVSEAVYPRSERLNFAADVEETCLIWEGPPWDGSDPYKGSADPSRTYTITEIPCHDNVESYALCEAVGEIPLN